jgi:small GTP-binding protein
MENNNEIAEIKDFHEIEDFSIKIVLVGNPGVGKSNILSRYVQNEFNHDSKATVGVELLTKTYKINDKYVKANIWDTAGQERYKSITHAYYKGAKGAMIVYDITKKDSFNDVDKWIGEIKEHGEKNISIMLIGNKLDLSNLRSVTTEEALDKAHVHSTLFKVFIYIFVIRCSCYGDVSEEFCECGWGF